MNNQQPSIVDCIAVVVLVMNWLRYQTKSLTVVLWKWQYFPHFQFRNEILVWKFLRFVVSMVRKKIRSCSMTRNKGGLNRW